MLLVPRRTLPLLLAAMLALLSIACNNEPADTSPTTSITSPSTDSTATTQTTQNTEQNAGATDPEPIMRPAQEVKVVDFNVLNGDETVAERAEELIPLLLSYEPDSIGLQEVSGNWINALRTGLGSNYGRVGIDSNGPDAAIGTSLSNYIYYRKDKFEVIDSGYFWLTETPDVPSSYNAATTVNRNCNWAIFEDKQTGFRYVHMNSHLDWQDDAANAVQCVMIAKQMLRFEEMGYPVFATADYNTKQGSASYQQIVSCESLADAHFVAERSIDSSATHTSPPIDFCFVTAKKMTVHVYEVIDNVQNGVTVSDHKGVFVRATVHALADQDALTEAPAFPSGTDATVATARGDVLHIMLNTQAITPNGKYAQYYRVTLKDGEGKVISTSNVGSGYLMAIVPEKLSFDYAVPHDGEEYTLEITPVGFVGKQGDVCRLTLRAQPTTAEAPGAPDILDLCIVDNSAVDLSPNAHEIDAVGSMDVLPDSVRFRGEGCLLVDGISDYYLEMQKGFSLEMKFKTPNDIQTAQSICSNCHAGGYGLSITGGRLQLTVYHDGAYRYVNVYINANTEYHVIAVYDVDSLSLYLDGKLAGTLKLNPGTMGLPTVAESEHLAIGADSEPGRVGQNRASGTVYYVKMYSVALTDENVLYRYQNR